MKQNNYINIDKDRVSYNITRVKGKWSMYTPEKLTIMVSDQIILQ